MGTTCVPSGPTFLSGTVQSELKSVKVAHLVRPPGGRGKEHLIHKLVHRFLQYYPTVCSHASNFVKTSLGRVVVHADTITPTMLTSSRAYTILMCLHASVC